LELAWRKIDDRVGQQFASTFEFNPLDLVEEALGANATRGPKKRSTSLAFHTHEFSLCTELVKILNRGKYDPIFIAIESFRWWRHH
jgi:hypothetical protein